MTNFYENTFRYYDDSLGHHREYARLVAKALEALPDAVQNELLEVWTVIGSGGAITTLASHLDIAGEYARAVNFRRYGATILHTCRSFGLTHAEEIAYVLATASYESAFAPVSEKRGKSGTKLWEVQNHYWDTGYYGRGFVQITWKENYAKFEKALGVPLVSKPQLALQPECAAKILVLGMKNGMFTGVALRDFVNAKGCDFVKARSIIGTNDSAKIANLANWYLEAVTPYYPSITKEKP